MLSDGAFLGSAELGSYSDARDEQPLMSDVSRRLIKSRRLMKE